MSIQQAEGWNLWEKSMVMRRQAHRRAVVSVLRRDRLASILVVLLTGTLLLGTSAFGGPGRCGIIKSIECLPPWPNNQMPDECCKCFGSCEKPPAPVSCRDGYVPTASGTCLPDLSKCPEGYHRTVSGGCWSDTGPDEFAFPCCYYEIKLKYAEWLRDAWSQWLGAGGAGGKFRDEGGGVIIKPDFAHWQMAFSSFGRFHDVHGLYEDYPGCVDPWYFINDGIPALIKSHKEALKSCYRGTERSMEIPDYVYEFCKSQGVLKDPAGHYYINTFCEVPTREFGAPRITAPTEKLGC